MKKATNQVHSCQAIVVSCMDFRLSDHLTLWMLKNCPGGFDRVAIAGSVKNLPFVLEQVELSKKLHHTKEVYLINHEDCGAYGADGTPERHKKDLAFAKRIISEKFPDMKVKTLYLTLAGEFTEV